MKAKTFTTLLRCVARFAVPAVSAETIQDTSRSSHILVEYIKAVKV